MTRYTITCTDKPGSKSRYRHALKMLGAELVRIEEKEVEAGAPPARPDTLPTSPEAKAVGELYGRKHETPWADEEIKAFKAAVKSTLLTLESMKLVSDFYRVERKREGNFCRTSILTFCRHFGTELDKARAAKPQASKKGEWLDSTPKVVALPDPAEADRIRDAARLEAEEFRKRAQV